MLFLSLDSPWPAQNGANLRSLGLLKELGINHQVELIVLSRTGLTADQTSELSKHTHSIQYLPQIDTTLLGKVFTTLYSLTRQIPYHSALVEYSLKKTPEIRLKIQNYQGIVFTNIGHWGCLIRNQVAKNWILNQCDADVEFWRVYATETNNLWLRLAALVSYFFSKNMYPAVYSNVSCVISVCEEDKNLTNNLAPSARVEVIQNGVDCSYLTPERVERTSPPRLLFTGTSVERNMLALSRFAVNILPMIIEKIPEVELLVAGRFSEKAQESFQAYPNIKFTGPVPDIRPYFNKSDVFIAPFEETHGSKLKITEAMAMALPIVSTIQGVRGFPLVDGETVLIAHNNEEFALQVIELLGNPPLRAKIGRAARKLAEDTLDWAHLGRRLNTIIYEVQKEIV